MHYKINVCEHLPASECGGTESAVCAHGVKENHYDVVGTLPAQFGDNVLVFNTSQTCPGSAHKIQSIINFLCGKSLGTPEFIKYDECVHYFEWRTFTACKKNKFRPIKEVPCYVFDSDYKKHDLNPLIKTSGGHLVNDWDPDSDLYINICRTIGVSAGETSGCPPKSAACLIKDGKGYDVGQPKDALASFEKDRLVLQYETENKPDFCNGHSPTVKIIFTCPSAGTEVSDPKLTASSNCRYEVEWVTENACHTEYLESDSCTLISKERGISIDLTPLTARPANPYHVQDPKGEYTYYLNVCGKISEGGCTGANVSSCQNKLNTQSKSAGSYSDQNLRYSDGDITLTYPGGETCSSGFQRMTVINFICNETAVNAGKGEPEFQSEADCTYFFSWQTKYACLKKKEEMCYVESKKKQYNLFSLIRTMESSNAQNWEAVNLNPSDKSRFYINVCHDVLQTGEASICDDHAAICSVGPNGHKNLGKFLAQPKFVNGHIVLEYTDGSTCAGNKQIHTSITLLCSPGNHESPPILKGAEDCYYEFEWSTAAACVVSRTEGNDCAVADPQAGFYFDLSPLTNKSGSYKIATDLYNFYINVCGNVTQQPCQSNSGACQVTKTNNENWNLGVGNSKLSYYDGMIQLSYTDGTTYNDEKKSTRSSLITFLCDRSVDIGQPEYQKEDNHTYNFKWYTKYACPALPVECVVVDKETDEQYDLSSLSTVQGEHSSNWFAMDQAQDGHKKYYINVCRSLVPVKGCDPFAAVCQTGYAKVSDKLVETVVINNLGVASKKPIIEASGKILLEYTNGSECTDQENKTVSYSSQLHLICEKGAMFTSPIFISDDNCLATFLWNTEAACPIIKSIHGKEDCLIENPNTGFIYNFESLKNESGYMVQGNGKTYKLNICGPVSSCGQAGNSPAAGCEIENNVALRRVKQSQSLDLSSEGTITLTYSGTEDDKTGSGDTFTINFVCNDDIYPGRLSFKREEINSETHIYHTFFDFETAMACSPAPVDCQVTDSNGNEYDLSDLSRDDEPWIAVDTTDQTTKRTFYLNICKPLPYTRGCSGGAVGSCMKTSDNKNLNLGYIQMSPQASGVGSLTIVYMSGDKCSDKKHYSTRIIFECDHNVGSPMFQEQDDCEYVFLWRTSEACPVARAEGDNCQVKDPKYDYVYDLRPLGKEVLEVVDGPYKYQLKVCGEIKGSPCSSQELEGSNVSSCQVKDNKGILAGLANQKLVYEDGIIMINYTGGALCHNKYHRSTLIIFQCDKTEGKPVFLRETPDCIYKFQWRTPLACLPFKPIDCSLKDTLGNSYDLSQLSHYDKNWEADAPSEPSAIFRINVCRPLVPETGPASCPHGSAACLLQGNKATNLGELASSPRWHLAVPVLEYKNGDRCPDGTRNKTTTIRFVCDLNGVVSRPQLITRLQDCDFNFVWHTVYACPLTESKHDECQVTNKATGYQFDLSSLTSKDGYLIKAGEQSIQLNICSDVKNSPCDSGVGVCVSKDGKHINAGKSQRQIAHENQIVKLVYEEGDQCDENPKMKHHSVFIFPCATDTALGSFPSLTDYMENTCMWEFTWYTSLACEQEIKCSVRNGTSLIDLSPLMKRVGYYEVLQSTWKDDSSDFYINICQPISHVDVKCPPGASACRVTPNGEPIDIGRPSSAPQIDQTTQTVSIRMDSRTPCDSAKGNYSTTIIFHCSADSDLGRPEFLQLSECNYLFKWETPLVCPDEESVSECSLTDHQLQYTFNFSSLSKETYKTSGLNSYYIGVCSSAQNVPSATCSGAVCLPTGNTAVSFGNANTMKMEYRHEENMVVLKYVGGDLCPPVTEDGVACLLPFIYKGKTFNGCTTEDRQRPWCATAADPEKSGKWGYCSSATDSRQSTILFKCDESSGKGLPVLLSETNGCSATFEWKTQLACLPKKLDCQFILNHHSYDLRMLSSLTGHWGFTEMGSRYYLNLCQRVNQGPSACSETASVCIESKGSVHVLGQVYTQDVTLQDKAILVTYTNGDLCRNDQKFSTTIHLICKNITGKLMLQSYDAQSCRYYIKWETRAACAVVPKEVKMTNGIIHLENDVSINLTRIYIKSYTASGDMRTTDQYFYEIQLSGKENSTYQKCNKASICQVKTNSDFTRAVGSAGNAKYYLGDGDLDVVFTSSSKCGKDGTKNATSSISLHCSPTHGEGRPEFIHETADCQYLFTWHTSAVCPLISDDIHGKSANENQYSGLSSRSQAVGAILSILLVILVACLVVLLLYKKERRETVMYKLTNCCRRSSSVSYKYTKINTEEEADNETEWLMEEVSANHGKPHHKNGHVTSVKAQAFTSLHVDDLDSEDEVLTVPEVRIQSARNKQRISSNSLGQYASGSDENLIGIANGGQEQTGKSRPGPRKKEDKLTIASFHDDSDEDMLNV